MNEWNTQKRKRKNTEEDNYSEVRTVEKESLVSNSQLKDKWKNQ